MPGLSFRVATSNGGKVNHGVKPVIIFVEIYRKPQSLGIIYRCTVHSSSRSKRNEFQYHTNIPTVTQCLSFWRRSLTLVDRGCVPTFHPIPTKHPRCSLFLRIVVHHDGLLDLHLYIEVQTSVVVVAFVSSDVLRYTATGGTEDIPPLSTSFCGLCGCAKRYASQRKTWFYSRKVLTVNVYENILTHDPNNHVSERSARGLRTKRPDVSCKPRRVS